MTWVILALTGVCCLAGMTIAAVAAFVLYRRSQQGGAVPASANGAGQESLSEPLAPDHPAPAAPVPPGMPVPPAPAEPGDDDLEDGPTVLAAAPVVAPRPPAVLAPPPPGPSRPAPPPPVHPPDDPSSLPTEHIMVPPRPVVPVRTAPSAAPEVPAPDAPPPLPPTHRLPVPGPPAPGLHLDRNRLPDTSSLQPGATIIPPDDWNDEAFDDADETMLMVRPPMPPKK